MNKKVRDARAKKSTRVKAEKVERSSGNVFADLGFHDADPSGCGKLNWQSKSLS